mmetsp:Transcript_14304/g.26734  ORF Transcript_14304/g.26734 Transcript_14304/m.26734 type:complete len:203 (+) Transcript_14304:1097-1705(+)
MSLASPIPLESAGRPQAQPVQPRARLQEGKEVSLPISLWRLSLPMAQLSQMREQLEVSLPMAQLSQKRPPQAVAPPSQMKQLLSVRKPRTRKRARARRRARRRRRKRPRPRQVRRQCSRQPVKPVRWLQETKQRLLPRRPSPTRRPAQLAQLPQVAHRWQARELLQVSRLQQMEPCPWIPELSQAMRMSQQLPMGLSQTMQQ